MSDIVVAAERRNILGEGPLWDARRGRLWWVDIKGRRVEWIAPGDGASGGFDLSVRPSSLATRGDGSLLVACDAGLGVLDAESGALDLRQPLEPDRPGNRTNDGGTDREGRFWVGTMDDAEKANSGAVYRLDPDWTCHRLIDGMAIPNTVATSPDGRALYLADSKEQTIYAWDLDEAGHITRQRDFVDTRGTEAYPDGSAMDAEGFLWNAQWGAWRVVRYRPDGSTDRIVEVPVEQPSSCAFGGPDLKTLYITSARVGLSDEALAGQPLAGSLFALSVDVPGLPVHDFGG